MEVHALPYQFRRRPLISYFRIAQNLFTFLASSVQLSVFSSINKAILLPDTPFCVHAYNSLSVPVIH